MAAFRNTLAVLLCVGLSGSALAQNKKVETAAKAAQKKAMEEDYLVTDFAKARERLEKAIADCGTDKCSTELRATLQRDLGTVLVGGSVDADAGVAAFAEALKLNPQIALDADLQTKDLDAAFEKAKKLNAGGGEKPAGGRTRGGDDEDDSDFIVTEVPQQVVRTPVPIYVEYDGGEELTRVVARYRGPGMTEWKNLELRKMGEGYGAELPCLDVQSGSLRYFIQGFSAGNDVVATGRDRRNPYTTTVGGSISGEAPHLPGQPAPAQCPDTGDCPPGFPGCNGGTVEGLLKDADLPCEADAECKSGKCETGLCTAPEKKNEKFKRIWIGASFGVDVSILPGAQNVCSLHSTSESGAVGTPVNDANYYCMDGDRDFPNRPPNGAENASIDPSRGNEVGGGAALGKFRILASFDYALTEMVLIGLRAGVAIPGYSGAEAAIDGARFSAPWLHLEARGTFVLGKDGIAAVGLRPYVYGALGVSTFESKVPVQVKLTDVAAPKDVDAWHLAGPVFVAAGGGARYAVSENVALLGGARLSLAFGNAFVPTLAPELGVQFGF